MTDANGEAIELTNSTFSQLLISPDRGVRRTAFHQYYEQFHAHENTLAATLAGSIHTDVYYAKARGYDSALAAALFPDNVPQAVYDNLIDPATHGGLEPKVAEDDLVTSSRVTFYTPSLAFSMLDPLGHQRHRSSLPRKYLD